MLQIVAPVGQDICSRIGLFCPPNSTGNTIAIYLKPFITQIIFFTAAFATAALVYGSFKYIMSRGDEEQAKRAKLIIIYAVIGIIIIGISGILVNVAINVGDAAI